MFDNELIYRPMTIDDYESIIDLWKQDAQTKITIRLTCIKTELEKYLLSSPNCSFVALYNDKIIGTVLGGTDYHRSFINHLYVDKNFRKHGIGDKLVELAETALSQLSPAYSYITVKNDNHYAISFWEKHGYEELDYVRLMWKNLHPELGDGKIEL